MYKDVLKRMTAIFLCACMVGTSVDVGGLTTYAAEIEVTEEEVPAVGEGLIDLESEYQAGNVEVKLYDSSYNLVYDGTSKTPPVSVTYNGKSLTSGLHYNVSYGTNINAGKGQIVISGTGGEYTGTINYEFNIDALDLSSSSVTVDSIEDQVYTGSAVKPAITLKANGKVIPSENYKLTYQAESGDTTTEALKSLGNKQIVIATNSSNCINSKTVNYEVVQKPLDDVSFTYKYQSTNPYTGGAVEPEIVIQYKNNNNTETLEKNVDYTVAYWNNEKATTTLTGKALIKITGIGNYSGYVEKEFSIGGRDISYCDVTLAEPSNTYIYDRTAKKPSVTVTDPDRGNVVLKEDTDYTVSYADNTNAGINTAKVTITGIGNYAGEKIEKFTIKPYDIGSTGDSRMSFWSISNQTYSGEDIKLGETDLAKLVMDKGIALKYGENQDFTVSYENNTNVSNTKTNQGKAIIHVFGQGNYEGQKDLEFTIMPRKLTNAVVTVENWTNPGMEPDNSIVTVTYEGEELEYATDYMIEFRTAINGNGVLVTGSDEEMQAFAHIIPNSANENYTGYKDAAFQICGDLSKATVNYVGDTLVYNGSKQVPKYQDLEVISGVKNFTLQGGTHYEIEEPAESTKAGEKTLTLKGIGNYTNANATLKYTIAPKPLSDKADFNYVVDKITYDGEEHIPDVKIELKDDDGNVVYTLKSGTDFTVEKDPNAAADAYTKVGSNIPLVVKANGNNFTGETTIYFNILPRSIGDNDTAASDINVSLDQTDAIETDVWAYTGKEIRPSIIVTRYGTPLTEGTDYEITSYADNIKAGTATITVTGKGNYNGAFKKTFSIKYSLSDQWASVKTVDEDGKEQDEFEYKGGNEIMPQLDVRFQNLSVNLSEQINEELVRGVDYEIINWQKNVNVSTDTDKASVTIKGKGTKFTGEKTIEFSIIPKNLDSEDIIWDNKPFATTAFNGVGRNQQSVRLKYQATGISAFLTQDTDFAITNYEDAGDIAGVDSTDTTGSLCINAGIVTMTLTAKEGGNYTGKKQLTFEIPKRSIADPLIQVTTQNDKGLIYNGTSQRLQRDDIELVLKGESDGNGGTNPDYTLKSDPDDPHVDYTVTSCVDSGDDTEDSDSACINAGTVTMTLTGQGNFENERTITYEIARKSLRNIAGTDWADGIEPTITGGDTTIYNRQDQTPEITIKDTKIQDAEGNDTVLEKDKDYTITYEKEVPADSGTWQEVTECKDAGNYRVKVEGIGNYKDEYSKSFTILPRDLQEDGTNNVDYRYDIKDIADQTFTGTAIIPEELEVFEYTANNDGEDGATDFEKDKIVLEKELEYTVTGEYNLNATSNQGDQKAVLTIEGTGNFKGTLTVEFTILPKNIEDITTAEDGSEIYDVLLEDLEIPYNGQKQTPDLPYVYNEITLVQGTDYSVDYEIETAGEEDGTTEKIATNEDVGPAYGTITGIGNYTGSRTFDAEHPIFTIIPRSLKDAFDAGEVTVEELAPVIYDGFPHEPNVVVKDTIKADPLVKDTDYRVEYTDVVNAGDQTAYIIGIGDEKDEEGNYKGNYSGTIEVHYRINPKSIVKNDNTVIDGSSIELIPEDWIYTGFEIEPKTLIKDVIKQEFEEDGSLIEGSGEEVTLVEGEDYDLTYSNNVDASSNTKEGKATVTVNFKNNYTGTYALDFEIQVRDINDKGIAVEEIEDLSYNQEIQQPDTVITYGKTEENPGKTLVRDTDYTLTYTENCVDAGTVTITIEGQGNFSGTRTTQYKIVPKSMDAEKSPDITVDAIPNQLYKGGNIIPEVTVYDGDTELVLGQDYETVPGTNTVLPGMATVVIKGKGNYSEQRSVEFKIIGDLGSDASIETIPVQAYTGTEVTPAQEPRVSFKGQTLVRGIDYDVVLDNNTDVGTATYTIVGKDGYYTGSKTVNFKIAYDISKDTMQRQTVITNVPNSYTYTSEMIELEPKVTYGGTELKLGTDYTISYRNNINVGTAEMIITGMNSYMGSVTTKFSIVQKSLANCSITEAEDFIYDGSEKEPEVVVKNGSKVLAGGVDYTVRYEANQEAGVGKVIITGNNNYSGTVIRYFDIKVAAPVGLQMTGNSENSITLEWKAGGTASGYEIYRLGSDGKYVKIATTTSLTYTNKKLANSKSYQYVVRAYAQNSNGKVYSSFTETLTTNTTPATPKINVFAKKKGQLKIKWSKLNSASGYEIYQSTSKKGTYKKIKTVTKKATISYTNKKLKSNKKYYYKVRAYNTINGKKVYGSYSSVKGKKVK